MLEGVFLRMLSLYTNGMGSFLDVVWVVQSFTKTVRGVSYPIIPIRWLDLILPVANSKNDTSNGVKFKKVIFQTA